jgi:hypothetical protein
LLISCSKYLMEFLKDVDINSCTGNWTVIKA